MELMEAMEKDSHHDPHLPASISSYATVSGARASCIVNGPKSWSLAAGLHPDISAALDAAQDRAVANARRAAELATDRYRAGIVSYLEVVDASREALQAQRGRARGTDPVAGLAARRLGLDHRLRLVALAEARHALTLQLSVGQVRNIDVEQPRAGRLPAK